MCLSNALGTFQTLMNLISYDSIDNDLINNCVLGSSASVLASATFPSIDWADNLEVDLSTPSDLFFFILGDTCPRRRAGRNGRGVYGGGGGGGGWFNMRDGRTFDCTIGCISELRQRVFVDSSVAFGRRSCLAWQVSPTALGSSAPARREHVGRLEPYGSGAIAAGVESF